MLVVSFLFNVIWNNSGEILRGHCSGRIISSFLTWLLLMFCALTFTIARLSRDNFCHPFYLCLVSEGVFSTSRTGTTAVGCSTCFSLSNLIHLWKTFMLWPGQIKGPMITIISKPYGSPPTSHVKTCLWKYLYLTLFDLLRIIMVVLCFDSLSWRWDVFSWILVVCDLQYLTLKNIL